MTRPRSKRSNAWRSIGGGKRTWRVVRVAFWEEEMCFKGLEGGSFGSPGGREVEDVVRVVRREVRRARGLGSEVAIFVGGEM